MTSEQIKELRKQYAGNFAGLREALRDEVRRLGRVPQANDNIRMLEAKANDLYMAEGDSSGRNETGRGKNTPPSEGGTSGSGEGAEGEGGGSAGGGSGGASGSAGSGSGGQAEGQGEGQGSASGGGDERKSSAQEMADAWLKAMESGGLLPKPKGDGEGDKPKDGGKGDADDEKFPKDSDSAWDKMMKELEGKNDEANKAAEEAKRKEQEAKELREKLDALKKKMEEEKKRKEEEAKRKEEERKRQEEEEAKNLKHYKTDELLETLNTTGIAYLVGPAGTGKTTLAMDACVAKFGTPKEDWKFKEKFAQISFSPDTTSGEMIGRTDINGQFHESEVVRVFRDGGIVLFDEIDNADASMLVKLNTAIANGTITTPNGIIRRNKDTLIVCTANTFGTGPDAMYVGRTRLDAATLDRFVMSTIEVDYDKKLEKKLMYGLSDTQKSWLTTFVDRTRKGIKAKHFRRLCSTRFVINAIKWLKSGKDESWVENRFFLGWSENERAGVK